MKKLKPLSPKDKKYLILILLLSFLIKLILASTVEVELRSDSMVYDTLAKNIIELGEYSFEGKSTALLISGYPIFLSGIYSLFGYEQIYVKIIQSILEVFTCLFFFLISRRFFDTKYSLIPAAIFAFFPSNILFSQTVLTEPLFGLLASVILYMCVRNNITNNIFLLGLIWGLAIMVRTSFAFSVILLPIYLYTHRQKIFEGFKKNRMKRAIQFSFIFAFGLLLALSPWIIRNKITMDTFSLATQGGFTFWSGSNPDATGTWYHKIEESNPLFDEENEVKRDKEFYKLGIEYAVKNPHKFLITGVKKLGYLFSSERMIILYFMPDEGKARTSTEVYKSAGLPFIALVNLPYFVVMLLGTWGLLSLRKKTFFLYGFIITWMVTIFMFVALARYHYVLIPFFILGTVKFIMDGKKILKEMNLYRKLIAIAFSLFLFGIWVSEFYLLFKS